MSVNAERIPETMHAVVLVGHGGFEKLEYRTDVVVPRPQRGEVLIRIGAAGVNNTDINTRVGWYSQSVRGLTRGDRQPNNADADAEDTAWTGSPLTFPRIQGIDVCGRIVAVGADVNTDRIGERVLVEPGLKEGGRVPLGAIWFLGSECDGGFAQFVVVPSEHAFRIQSQLSDVELASFPCSYSTAENLLTRASVARGDVVLVTGASGGVGSAAVQLAIRRGAQVIAVAGTAKADQVRALGASEVLDRHKDLLEALGAEAVHVAIDVVGGPGMPELLEVLTRFGRYAVSGAIAGPITEIDLRKIYLKDLSLFGCTVLDSAVFPNLVRYIELGEVNPVVAAVYPLDQIVDAQKVFMRKEHVGKIVLVPPEK